MKQLTIEHLAAYLPYGVRVISEADKKPRYLMKLIYNNAIVGISTDNYCGLTAQSLLQVKPILRPLSDLTREITHNGETFVPMDVLHRDFPQAAMYYAKQTDANNLPYCIMKQLLTWHVDIFELIESGLAIDINTIKTQSK